REKYERLPPEARTARVLADRTYPVADGTSRQDGKVEIAATYRKIPRMHPLHSLEGRWGSTARLPLDASFLQKGQTDSQFDAYLLPGTLAAQRKPKLPRVSPGSTGSLRAAEPAPAMNHDAPRMAFISVSQSGA